MQESDRGTELLAKAAIAVSMIGALICYFLLDRDGTSDVIFGMCMLFLGAATLRS